MQYAAIALAFLGAAIGARFRLRFLVGVIALLLPITLVLVLVKPYSVRDSLIIIMAAQALLQGGYFAGLVGRVFFSRIQGKLSGLFVPKAERWQERDG
jgi:hypothetical protein